jgi:hypothetical protein
MSVFRDLSLKLRRLANQICLTGGTDSTLLQARQILNVDLPYARMTMPGGQHVDLIEFEIAVATRELYENAPTFYAVMHLQAAAALADQFPA